MEPVTTNSPKPRRRWFQYKLRSLLILMLLLGAAMSWLAAKRNQAQRQRLAAEAIVSHGGDIVYDYQLIWLSGKHEPKWNPNAEPSGPSWLRRLFGEDVFAGVVRARIVNDSDIDSLQYFPELERLELAAPLDDASHLNRLAGLKRLKSLRFDMVPLANSQLEYIKGLTSLRILSIENAQITDDGLQTLEGLHDLEQIGLTGPKLSDAGLVHIAGLTRLTRLDLHGRGFTDAGLAHLRALTHLRELYLVYTSVSDAGLDELTALPELETLDLGWTRVTDKGLLTLTEIKTLRKIAVGMAVTAEGISRFQQLLPNCSVLPTDRLGVPVGTPQAR